MEILQLWKSSSPSDSGGGSGGASHWYGYNNNNESGKKCLNPRQDDKTTREQDKGSRKTWVYELLSIAAVQLSSQNF